MLVTRGVIACLLFSIACSTGEQPLPGKGTNPLHESWIKELEDGTPLHESWVDELADGTEQWPTGNGRLGTAGEQGIPLHESWIEKLENGIEQRLAEKGGYDSGEQVTLHESWKENITGGTKQSPTEEGVYVFAGEQILGSDQRPTEEGVYVSTGEQIPLESWIGKVEVGAEQRPTENGEYDCATHSLVNPCENADGYELRPLLPTCKEYAICHDRRLKLMLKCADGKLFDHRLKLCMSEEMAECPCREKFSSSEATDGPDQISWYDTSSGTKYVWITDMKYRHDKNNGSQSKPPKVSKIETMSAAVGKSGKFSAADIGKLHQSETLTVPTAMIKGQKVGTGYPTFYPTVYPTFYPTVGSISKTGKSASGVSYSVKSHKIATLEPTPSSSTDMATNVSGGTKTGSPNTYVPSVIYIPTIALPAATSEPAVTMTRSPKTVAPSTIREPASAMTSNPSTIAPSAIYSPTIALNVPHASGTGSPNTVPPSDTLQSKNPTITLPSATSEPTATINSSPSTSFSPSFTKPLSYNPTISLSSTAPSKLPSYKNPACISGSEIYSFESGVFPISPWTTGGDGNWTIYEDRQSPTWIKSPDLTGANSIAISNASVSICETFSGGTMSIIVLANVLPPTDVFKIYVDGVETMQLIDVNDWSLVAVDIAPGRHVIDLSFQYNIFSVDPLSTDLSRGGAVFIDNISFVEAFIRATVNGIPFISNVGVDGGE